MAKKTWHLLKNPKLILSALALALRKTKKFLKRLPKLIREYFFLLAMSAENNIHRLKRKNFHDLPTLTEFRTYQKQLRQKTFKLALTGALTVMLIISLPGFFQNYFAHSKTWQWVQSNWNGNNGNAMPSYLAGIGNLTNWGHFYSKSNGNAITANATGVTLSNVASQTAKEDGTTAFAYSGVSTATNQGVYATGGGASTGVVGLKKLQGATCALGNECISGGCAGNVCCADACCGVASVTQGTFTYGLVLGADNKCWLDRNLGAKEVAIAKVSNPCGNFAYCDPDSYGWLFQWGRKDDGHQYTAWGGQPLPALSGTAVGPVATSTVSSPNDVKFLTNSASPFDWLSPKIDTLWNGVAAVNNPCPAGFRLPTGGTYTGVSDGNGAMQGEWAHLISTSGITNYTNAASSVLHLPAAGGRYPTGALYNQDSSGFYWSSSPNSASAFNFYFNSGSVDPADYYGRAYGFSVRCLKD